MLILSNYPDPQGTGFTGRFKAGMKPA